MSDLDVSIISRRVSGRMYGFLNAFIKKTLGLLATTRNWSTTLKLSEMP